MFNQPKLEVWQYDDGSWACSVNGGRTVHASTRDEAIYWGGWWAGRRELGEDVAQLVSGGGRMTIVDSHTRRPPSMETPDP
jgi:hypothetical protein